MKKSKYFGMAFLAALLIFGLSGAAAMAEASRGQGINKSDSNKAAGLWDGVFQSRAEDTPCGDSEGDTPCGDGIKGEPHSNGGGFVAATADVSSRVWISYDSAVCDNARVYGEADVFGGARVCGNAKVYGNAKIAGNARVGGIAHVSGGAKIGGEKRINWQSSYSPSWDSHCGFGAVSPF